MAFLLLLAVRQRVSPGYNRRRLSPEAPGNDVLDTAQDLGILLLAPIGRPTGCTRRTGWTSERFRDVGLGRGGRQPGRDRGVHIGGNRRTRERDSPLNLALAHCLEGLPAPLHQIRLRRLARGIGRRPVRFWPCRTADL
jgi:hypothetical protein